MRDATLLKTGIVGSVIVAVCCFTPVLVIALGAVGLAAWIGWLDFVLLPALAVFLALTGYGLWRRQRAGSGRATGEISNRGARHG